MEENHANPDRVTAEAVDGYWETLRFPGNRRASVNRANTDREPALWENIGSLAMPVLILWGEQDNVVPLSHGKAFAAAIPNSTLVTYSDAGHLPMEEVPKKVAKDIAQWMAQLGRT